MMKEHHEKHGTEKRPAKGFFEDPWRVGLSLLVIVLLAYIAINSGNTPPAGPPSGNQSVVNKTVKANVTIELFVMSQCPYGVQAEGLVKNVIDTFGGEVNLSLRFIANEGANGSFTSLHGQNEVDEDLRQVCIIKYYPEKILNYTFCIAVNYSNAGSIWERCANESSMSPATIRNCSSGAEGKALMKDNIALSNSLQIYSSPTLLLNNNTMFSTVQADQIRQAVCAYDPTLRGCNKTLSGAGTTAPSGGCG